MSKNILTNIGVSFISNIILLLLSFFVPRLFLLQYGSDTNGLLTTLSQIFSYIALLEAGISQATLVQLYSPLKNRDTKQVSLVMSVSRYNYRKITYIYSLLVIMLSFFLPNVINSELDYWTICLCVLFEGAAGVINFYYFSTKIILLNADGKGYVNEFVNLIGKFSSYCVKIVLAITGVGIVFIQFGSFAISLFKMLFYKVYFKRNYSWVDYSITDNVNKDLPDKNAYILSELAWTIFSSTDAIVLSIFCSTKMASVYTINNMAFVAINSLLSAAYFGIRYELGRAYHESAFKYVLIHDSFNAFFMGVITALMGVAVLLFDSFIELYTYGVEDIDYALLWLPVFLCITQILSWARYVSGNLTSLAGYATAVSKISLLEAGINLLVSVLLVNFYGIYGVVLATVLALPIKVVYTNYISDKFIMKRSGFLTLSRICVDLSIFSLIVLLRLEHPFVILSWSSFFLHGIFLSIIFIIVMLGIHFLLYPNFRKVVLSKRVKPN